jgi:hypothetical protein
MTSRIATVLVTIILAATVAVGVFEGRTYLANRKAQKIENTAISAAMMHASSYTVGIVSDNVPAFVQTCRCSPNVAVEYIRIGDPVSSLIPHEVLLDGATPLLELEPFDKSLSSIIAGQQDQWLTSYARMVKSQKAAIDMSFAPESNGYWYSWGWPNVQPATEVAAWQHVVTVFRRAGATNVKWIWIVNQLWDKSGPLPRLWPGQNYVDEVGIDGYFRKTTDTFDSIFGPTITQLRQIASKPIVITETAGSPQAGQARTLTEITAGIAKFKLSGFIWFNINQGTNGLGHANWAINDDPQALTEYSAVVKKYERLVPD